MCDLVFVVGEYSFVGYSEFVVGVGGCNLKDVAGVYVVCFGDFDGY